MGILWQTMSEIMENYSIGVSLRFCVLEIDPRNGIVGRLEFFNVSSMTITTYLINRNLQTVLYRACMD